MDDVARVEIARRWLDRYGESIDCEEITAVASEAALARTRAAVEDARALDDFIAFLEGIAEQFEKFLDRRRPGTQVSLRDTLETFARVRERSPEARAADLKDFAIPAVAYRVLLKLQAETQELRARAEAIPEAIRRVKTRAADPAFGATVHFLAAWVRARTPDDAAPWLDVRRCLYWHGHQEWSGTPDYRAIDKEEQLRQIEHRYLDQLGRSGE